MKFLAEIQAGLAEKKRSLSLLSGDDLTYCRFISAGGHGVISVASHVCPRGMLEIEAAVAKGESARADDLQQRYFPIFQALFVESNPVPLKWMLAKLGLAENRFRLPLVPVGKEAEKKLEKVLELYHVEAGEYRR